MASRATALHADAVSDTERPPAPSAVVLVQREESIARSYQAVIDSRDDEIKRMHREWIAAHEEIGRLRQRWQDAQSEIGDLKAKVAAMQFHEHTYPKENDQ